jgi:sigma-E factor negative regulatory protein RseC
MENRSDMDNLLKETGTVVSVDASYVYVKTQRSTGCSGCSSEEGCGTSALSKLFIRDNSSPLKVRRTLECEVGDKVELILDQSRLLKHSFMAYGLPLIGLFVVSIGFGHIAEQIGFNESITEIMTIIGGLAGLLIGWKVTQTIYDPVLPELGKVLKN